MLDEEKIKRAFKIKSYNLNRLREEAEELRKKLYELEKRADNLFKFGEN